MLWLQITGENVYKHALMILLLLFGIMLPVSPAEALTGTGLPRGCSGGESRYEVSYPYSWEMAGTHMRLIYKLPKDYDWCWVSHHGRVDTDWADGGADNWEAVLRNEYYSAGKDKLEVLVPTRFWYPYYLYYIAMGFTPNEAKWSIANLFWVWAYY